MPFVVRLYEKTTERLLKVKDKCKELFIYYAKGYDKIKQIDCKGGRAMTENYYENCNIETETGASSDYAQWQTARDVAWQEMMERKATFFGKWMWILFLMIIPNAIHAIMTLDFVIEMFPQMTLLGSLFGLGCSIASGLILVKMSERESQYQIAGIFMIITNVINTVIEVFEVPDGWAFFIVLPTLVLGLIATYNEFMAHASVMSGIDDMMSKKWSALWTWYVRMLLCFAGSIILMLIIPLIGLVALLGAAIGVVVVSIVKIVYLYRSAKICRGYFVEQ